MTIAYSDEKVGLNHEVIGWSMWNETAHLFHMPLHEPVAQLVIMLLHRRIKLSTARSSRDPQRRIGSTKHLRAGIRSSAPRAAVGHSRGSSRRAGCRFQVSFGV